MRAPAALQASCLGLDLPTRVGLGCGLDPRLTAVHACARFGVGFVEVGPFAWTARPSAALSLDRDGDGLVLADPPESIGRRPAPGRIDRLSGVGVPVFARLDLTHRDADIGGAQACGQLAAGLAPHVAAFTIAPPADGDADPDWSAVLAGIQQDPAHPRPVLLVVAADLDAEARADACARVPLFSGVLVDGVRRRPGERRLGAVARDAALDTVRDLRRRFGPSLPIVAGGGVHEPQHARDLFAAGADLVTIDSGLVFGGPGLPKRINEALESDLAPVAAHGGRAAEMSWPWTLLMGSGMLAGSVLAFAIATTRVVLPYDEHFVGLTRHQLQALNQQLLPFLTHDRVTLAGAMVSLGVLYASLSWFGSRRGRHWAQVAIVASAFAGSASFFLFLGFGYFDPFHAFVTAILFQLLLFGVHGRLGAPSGMPPPMLVEDGAWRLGLWGQLGLVVQGVGFIGAGLIISAIGATHVFVHEDLEFLGTTAHALAAATSNLVPLVAHDRATLGGMLLANGLVILLTALWGFKPGERWLWWTLFLAGLPGYGAALGVHYAVGYKSAFHLAPAFLGLGLFAAALAASWPSLCRRQPDQRP